MKLKDITKAAHNLVYEEDEPKNAGPNEAPDPQPPVAVSPNKVLEVRSADTANSSQVEEVYKGLLARTDPNKCERLGKLYQAAAKLDHLIPDRMVRLKAAATTQNFDTGALKEDVQALKAALAHEVERVRQSAEQAKAQSIENAQRDADALRKEIEEKQRELQQRLVDIENSRTKIAAKESAFAQASTRRSNELDEIEREVAAI